MATRSREGGEGGGGHPSRPEGGEREPARDLRAVLSEHADRLLAIEGVAGIAQGVEAGEPVVVVLATDGLDRVGRERIPAQIDGYGVVIRRTGPFHASPDRG